MDNLKFDWHANIIESKQNENKEELGTLLISGELVNGDVCANNFALDIDELPKVASQVKDATLRLDHSKSARDVIGGFRLGSYDEKNKRVMFEAEIDDPSIQRSIMKGRLKYISIGASADAFCSKCNSPSRPIKTCKCKGSHDIIKNIKLKEASIVTEPAYRTSEFSPMGFAASITAALAAVQVTPNSSEEEKAGPFINKTAEEKINMTEDIKATTLKPAGVDAVVLLGEKLEAIASQLAKYEERFRKEEEAKKKAEIEENKKKEEEEVKKKEEVATKLEQLSSAVAKFEELMKVKVKKDETSSGIPKDVPASKFEKTAPCEEEEEEPEEEETVKKAKKKEAPVKGAKVESPEETAQDVTAEAIPAWFKEIRAFAEAHLMD
jgi:hypothetical protein